MKAVVEFLRQLHTSQRTRMVRGAPRRMAAIAGACPQLRRRVDRGNRLVRPPSVEGLTAKDCTYRIYRDVRFSRDKSPYKTWQGIYVAPHGKKRGMRATISTSKAPPRRDSSAATCFFPDSTCRIPRCSEAYARRFWTMARNLSGTSGAPKDSRSTSRSD